MSGFSDALLRNVQETSALLGFARYRGFKFSAKQVQQQKIVKTLNLHKP